MIMYVKAKDLSWANNLLGEEWINFVASQKDPTDKWQDAWTEVARDRVHNLDLSIPEHRDIYDSTLRTHIMFGEVNWNFERVQNNQFDFIENTEFSSFLIPTTPRINLKVYKDTKGYRTIGIGFNMDRAGAESEWRESLGHDISFNDARNGKVNITKDQAYQLFDHSIKIREKILRNKIGADWELLKPNEKITIISMYYNLPGLIGPKFTVNIKQYLKTKDKEYLKNAFFEAKYQSNAKVGQEGDQKTAEERVAVQKRMDREAAMLESYKCPLYSKPGDDQIPGYVSMQITLGETVIPRIGKLEINEEEIDDYGNKKQYYIWRTQGDDKVRLKHEFFEGKIFHIDSRPSIGHPGDDFNCRCVRDFNIPGFIQTRHVSGEIIRKHITNLFEIPGFWIG
jgi:hypothetical protein